VDRLVGGVAMSNWFQNQRIAWIKESVEIFGFIQREHVQKKFGISTPQASADIGDCMAENPNLMVYNKSAKRYERAA
jgi:hypothetical protein